MNFTLKRDTFVATGIFGMLVSADESLSLYTCEHAFPRLNPDSVMPGVVYEAYYAAVPPGVYICQRGQHQLEGMTAPFETFMLLDVPGHTNILIHSGNVNADSEGCILVGRTRNGNESITESRLAFADFMSLQDGIDQFQLRIL